MTESPQRLTFRECQRRLTVAWLLGALPTFLLLIAQSLGDVYGSQLPRAWSWLIPNVAPTAGLLLSVTIYDAVSETQESGRTADRFAYTISFWITIVYMAILLLTLVMAPWTGGGTRAPIDTIQMSNYWLGPLQGIVDIVIGVFFVKREREQVPEPAESPRTD